MKLLVAGDLHGDQTQVKKLANQASEENVDFVVLAGDFTAPGEDGTGMIGPFLEKGKRVLLLSGNWESLATTEALAEIYGVKSLHGYSLYVDDVGLFGCGAANVGLFQLEETEVSRLLKKGFNKIKDKKKKIMVTHVHPEDELIKKLSPWEGSTAVKDAITELKPDIAIFSHMHELEGLEHQIGKTKLFCVGKSGKIIDV